jgi:predicted Zn-dependent protease
VCRFARFVPGIVRALGFQLEEELSSMKAIHRVWLSTMLLAVIASCSVTQKGEPELPVPSALLVHGRADEREADTWAVRCAAGAGYDPRGIALFFGKQPVEQRDPFTWLQLHPSAPDRVEHVNQVIAREHLSGGRVGVEALAPIQRRLAGGAPVSWR